MTYEAGDLFKLVADDTHDDLANMLEQVLPIEEAAELHAEIHTIAAQVLPPGIGLIPLVMQTACTLAQAGYVLGARHGCEMVGRANDELDRMSRGEDV